MKFDALKYEKLLEYSNDIFLQKHMQKEKEFLLNLANINDKTIFDLGAGYGRILKIIKDFPSIIAIELLPNMFEELNNRYNNFSNIKLLNSDITKINDWYSKVNMTTPVFLIMQNTLGTIMGSTDILLESIKNIIHQDKGEIIISLFRQKALSKWGLIFYESIQEMAGKVDFDKSIFEEGIFVSNTGYKSKWFNDNEIKKIIEYFELPLVNEYWDETFCILHLSNL